MKRDAATSSNRPRPRKKAADPVSQPPPEPAADAGTVDSLAADADPGEGKNVSPLEGGVSLAAGVMVLVAALFPRSIKQLLLLGLGGFLVYRGTTGKCELYAALGIDTAKRPLLDQINEKYLS